MPEIPAFPTFRRFTFDDQKWYDDYYSLFDPYADFSFGNLIVWLDYHDDLAVSQLNGCIVFQCTNIFMDKNNVITLIGKANIATIETILAYQRAVGLAQCISMVPEVAIERLSADNSRYLIREDRANYDYIFRSDHLADLRGGPLRQRRREVHAFQKSYSLQSHVAAIDLGTKESVDAVVSQLHAWRNAYSDNDPERHEAKALDRFFGICECLPHKCCGLFINNILEGFILYQLIPKSSTAIFNHIKVSHNYRYMESFLKNRLAQNVRTTQIEYVNMEQDLGIPGLRRHKSLWKPTAYLRKYTIQA